MDKKVMKKEVKRILTYLSFTVFVFIFIYMLIYVRYQVTGYAVLQEEKTDLVGERFSGSEQYIWDPQVNGPLDFIKMSGSFTASREITVSVKSHEKTYIVFSSADYMRSRSIFSKVWSRLKGIISDTESVTYDFKEFCTDTCHVTDFYYNEYVFLIEVQNATFYLDSITYRPLVEESDKNTQIHVYDSSGYNKAYVNDTVTFYAQYTSKKDMPIINARCTLEINIGGAWTQPFEMTYSSDLNEYSAVRTFSERGSYSYVIRCDATDKGYDKNLGYEKVVIANRIPMVEDVKLLLQSIQNRSSNDLAISYTYYDPDNDPQMTVFVDWIRNNQLFESSKNKTILDASHIKKNEKWKARLRVNDGVNWSDWKESNELFIGNNKPIVEPSINSSDGTNMSNSTLIASFDAFDPDGDSIEKIDIIWYENDKETDFEGHLNISSEYTNRGDVWYYQIRVFDGQEWSDWEISPNLKITNLMPTHARPLLISWDDYNRTNTTLQCINQSTHDTDSSYVINLYRWYKNNEVIRGYISDTLPKGYFQKGDILYCEITPTDGEVNGTSLMSKPIQIQNTAPVIINKFSKKTVNDNMRWVYRVVTIDNDAMEKSDTLIYETSNDILSIDSLTGHINITPKEEDAGNYNVTISVTDATSSDSFTVNYTIIDRTPPRIINYSVTPLEVHAHMPITLNATIYEGNEMEYYFLSIEEQARWRNLSKRSGTKQAIDEVTITSVRGETIRFRWYLCDTYGNCGFSDIYKMVVDNAPPEYSRMKDITWDKNQALYEALDLESVFYDYDNDSLAFKVVGGDFIHAHVNSDGKVSFSQPFEWSGTEQVYFIATDNITTVRTANITLTVRDVSRCGDTFCSSDETCSSCEQDCGTCPSDTETSSTSETESQEKTHQTTSTARSYGGGAGPIVRIPGRSSLTPVQGTTIVPAKIEVNALPCLDQGEGNSKRQEFELKPYMGDTRYFDRDIIIDPFTLSCTSVSSFTLNIPANYHDVKVFHCSGDECQETNFSITDELRCGDNLIEQFYNTSQEYASVAGSQKQLEATITTENNHIQSGLVSATFFNFADPFTVTLIESDSVLPQPKNPSLTLLGRPIELMVKDTYASVNITLPYQATDTMVDSSIAVYIKRGMNWVRLSGNKDARTLTVTGSIDNVGRFISEEGKVTFALGSISCVNCSQTEMKKIYDTNASRDAVLLVHGLASSPATFQEMIDDFTLTNQPWQVWTYQYPSTETIEDNAKDLADYLEQYQNQFENIYIVAHSLGGLITEKALMISKQSEDTYLPKVKKVILIGVPHKGSPVASVYHNLFDWLINKDSKYNLFALDDSVLKDLISGINTSQVPGVSYYVIAGTKEIDFQATLLHLKASDIFDLNETNDGIITVTSAYTLGDQKINSKCHNYWEIDANHMELIDIASSRQRIEKIISKELIGSVDDVPLIGNNKYIQVSDTFCGDDEYYVVVGEKIDIAMLPDETGCNCGNNVCGIDENPQNCPIDCMLIKRFHINSTSISYILLFLCVIVLVIASLKYRQIVAVEHKYEKRNFMTHHKYEEEKEKVAKEIRKEYYQSIETDIDRLYKLVASKGKIKIGLAAELLNMEKGKLQEWAHILEKHKMIRIHYPIIGEAELIKL